MAARADRGMRADLQQQAQLVAQAVNVQNVQALSGTKGDLDNPAYLRLKDQLAAVRAANPQCRIVYLMGRKADGTIFFFADSEPAGSQDCSPPGQVYDEVPAGDRRVFDTRAAATAGPYSDRWGTWVSGLVPITDPQTGGLVAVLGMDFDARDWQWNVAAKAALPAGLILLLLIGGVTVFVATRTVTAPRQPWGAVGLLAAGFLVTGLAVLYAKAEAEADAQREFDVTCNEIRLQINNRLVACAQILHSGAALFDASVSVERDEWRAFTTGLQLEQQLPGIQGVGYAQLIPGAQLAQHVSDIRREGFPDYQIKPAGERETYSAIIYLAEPACLWLRYARGARTPRGDGTGAGWQYRRALRESRPGTRDRPGSASRHFDVSAGVPSRVAAGNHRPTPRRHPGLGL